MTRLQSYVSGAWRDGTGAGRTFGNPVTGESLGVIDSSGIDIKSAMAFARQQGGAALRAMTFAQRGALLDAIAGALSAKRTSYDEIARLNSGNTKRDAAIDIDGGIGTLKYYARLGKSLGEAKYLIEERQDQLNREGTFFVRHIWSTRPGVAVCINAFNFPSWGLWEKAAVALLAGVPVVAKPASASAWLAERMVRDVVDAGVVPPGILTLICGSAEGLLDAIEPFDHLSFTGSADTGLMIRSQPGILRNAPRVAIEADSVNCAVLGESANAGSPAFELIVREVASALTIKAGQLCTNIRRVLVPRHLVESLGEALAARIDTIVSGDPADDSVTLGPLMNAAQQSAALEGLERLRSETRALRGGGRPVQLTGADPARGAFIAPTLLQAQDSAVLKAVHDVEVFGPAATLIAYDSMDHAIALAARGGGSLAASVWSEDAGEAACIAAGLAPAHGRVMCVDPQTGKGHTGHGIVMPQGVHGGPGRAGGGEELGGLRGLRFYMQRSAIQGSLPLFESLSAQAVTARL